MANSTISKNSVRIIGGDLRSRKIEFPIVDGLRPSSDRVRETLFNWFQFEIVGQHCLDLFAGSGALGIEALSRGAERVTFIEKNPQAAAAIKRNLDKLELENAEVHCHEAVSWLSSVKKGSDLFDTIFIDPPFSSSLMTEVIEALEKATVLAKDCRLYIESGHSFIDTTWPKNWEVEKHKKAGNVYFGIIKINKILV